MAKLHLVFKKNELEIQNAFREIKLNGIQKNASIIYGNTNCGFYKASEVETETNSAKISIIPPCFNETISFYSLTKHKRKLIKKTIFSPSYPSLQKVLKVVSTKVVPSKFYLITILFHDNWKHIVGRKTSKVQTMLESRFLATTIVLNYRGEIIWAKRYEVGGDYHHRLDTGKILSNGGHFLDFKEGQVLHTKHNITTHHPTTLYNSEVYFFEKQYRYYLTSFISKPATLETSHLYKYNYKEDQKIHILDFFDHIFKMYDLASISTVNHHENNIDWSHENSVDVTDHGILVSFKNLNKIYMFDSEGENILWSLGGDKSDTYTTPRTGRFIGQHSAIMVNTDSLALVDNNINRSRFLQFSLQNPVNIICTYTPQHYPLWAPLQGSVHHLNKDQFLVGLHNTNYDLSPPYLLVHSLINLNQCQEKGRLDFYIPRFFKDGQVAVMKPTLLNYLIDKRYLDAK